MPCRTALKKYGGNLWAPYQLAVIRQLCLNIPILLIMNVLFGMSGIVWTQLTADLINVVISYVIYARLIGGIAPDPHDRNMDK